MRKTACAALTILGVISVLVLSGPPAGAQQINKSLPTQIPKQIPPMAAKPDLVVRKIWFAKWVDNPQVQPLVPITTDLEKGVKVWIVCEYANQGPGNLKGLWLLGYYVDEVLVTNNSLGDLNAGAGYRGFGIYTPTTVGPHTLRCMVDYYKNVAEADETNNSKSVTFKVMEIL
jgi:hypothetical protein